MTSKEIKLELLQMVKQLPVVDIPDINDFIFHDFGPKQYIKVEENGKSTIYDASNTQVDSIIRDTCRQKLRRIYIKHEEFLQMLKDNPESKPGIAFFKNIIIIN